MLFVFAAMVTIAGLLLLVPEHVAPAASVTGPARYSRWRTAAVAGAVGLGAGLVGASGGFMLVPLLMVAVKIPIRVTIGSSLAITAVAALAGTIGKFITAQIPLDVAAMVALGALPRAQLGALVSRRLTTRQLRVALGVVIVIIAVRVWWDLAKR